MISKLSTLIALGVLSQASFAELGKGLNMKGEVVNFPLTKTVIEDDFFGDEILYTLKTGNIDVKSAGSKMFGSVATKFGQDVTANSDLVVNDPIAISAYTHAIKTVEILEKNLNFNLEIPVRIVTDQYLEAPWSIESPNLRYSEAGYIRKMGVIAFSPGSENTTSLAKSQDIVAHEIAHLVVAQTSKLDTGAGSQAINEAIGDLLGIYVESKVSPDNWNWKIGEESYLDGVSSHRDIEDLNDPRVLRHKNDFTAERAHALSGIITTTFYYLVTGEDLYGDIILEAVDMDTAMKLYFDTVTKDLDSSTNFTKMKKALLERAPSLAKQIEAAFAQVGM